MVQMNRLEKIRQMLASEPNDVFLRYALAMELDSAGQADDSLEAYENLMSDRPPHVPSFFRAGQLLARLGRTEQARTTLDQGIQHAMAQGDAHAAAEMNELLGSLAEADDVL
jgi:tetratricopeptide (TPR) repeat protein